jgi:hypothetical protein
MLLEYEQTVVKFFHNTFLYANFGTMGMDRSACFSLLVYVHSRIKTLIEWYLVQVLLRIKLP